MYISFAQVLAAHRYGIKRVLLPERNLKDLAEVPAAVLASMEVIIIYYDWLKGLCTAFCEQSIVCYQVRVSI